MQETVSAKDAKRSIIILATESVENEDAMKQIIGVAGNGQELHVQSPSSPTKKIQDRF